MTSAMKKLPTVIVIEDDPRTAADVAKCLGASGRFDCLATSETADEGIRLAKRHQPTAVLFDLVLQNQERPEAIAEIRKVAQRSTVLALTTFEDTQLIVRALLAGAQGYLLKTDGIHKVPERLREALDEGAPMGPRVIRRVCNLFHELGQHRKESGFDLLTSEEREILLAISAGKKNPEIAREIGIGHEVLKSRIELIFEKLRVRTRTEAASVFSRLSMNWLPRDTQLGSRPRTRP
jgi:DNA-binding NarL/FixJ family response regulator